MYKVLGIICLCTAILLILSQFVEIDYIEDDKEGKE